jgi:hypothetical protein
MQTVASLQEKQAELQQRIAEVESLLESERTSKQGYEDKLKNTDSKYNHPSLPLSLSP